jgi:hypothetical protein
MGRLKETDLTKVSDLITTDHKWNVHLIQSLLLAPDDEIMKIPLRHSFGEDWLAWSKDKIGLYSVQSAYRAIIDQNQVRQAEANGDVATSSLNDENVSKKLWQLPVVPKVCVFGGEFFEGFYLITGLSHG